MKKLRYWIIKKLARGDRVVMNVSIDDVRAAFNNLPGREIAWPENWRRPWCIPQNEGARDGR